MFLKSLIMTSLLLMAPSCFTYVWKKDGLTESEAKQQEASCKLESERHYSDSTENRPARIIAYVDLCMQANGWQKTGI